MTPSTESGRAMLPRCVNRTAGDLRAWVDGAFREFYCIDHHRPLAECADEMAEAVAAERARLASAVRGMPRPGIGIPGVLGIGEPMMSGYYLGIAAVLRLLEGEG